MDGGMKLACVPILVAASLTPAAAAEKVKVAVLPIQIEESAKDQVPELIDDYILTAVQKIGLFEVIGQDDINAMLGFEEQKDLLGCEDTSCFAAIGGALGVEKLISVRVARTEQEWATSAKLIHIVGDPKVEARAIQFVPGRASDLLRAVPSIVRKLILGEEAAPVAGPQVAPRAEPQSPPAPAPPPPSPAPSPTYWATGMSLSSNFGYTKTLDEGEAGNGYLFYASAGYRLDNGLTLDMTVGVNSIDSDTYSTPLFLWTVLFGGRWDMALVDGLLRPFFSLRLGYSTATIERSDSDDLELSGLTATAGFGLDIVLGPTALFGQLEVLNQNSDDTEFGMPNLMLASVGVLLYL
jgi:hypothetical protein